MRWVPTTLALVFGAAASASPPDSAVPSPASGPHRLYAGSIHNHTAYSDGEGRPEDAFAAGRDAGMNFLFVTEHSEWLEFPFRADEACLFSGIVACFAPPPAGTTEWEDVRIQGERASDPTRPYLGLRGFEWSSPTLGHVNVLLSRHYTGTGPEAPTMDIFWRWFLLDESLGGGADGLATFNHPSREHHPVPSMQIFEDFRYVPEADPRVVGVEAFNRRDDYSGCYARALDKGWHVGAIGAADNHGDWGRPDRSRTVLMVPGTRFTAEAVRRALLARRFYATFDHDLRIDYRAGGARMGSRLERPAGQAVTLTVEAEDPDPGDAIARAELFGTGIPEQACDRAAGSTALRAEPLAAAPGNGATARLEVDVVPEAGAESWYFARVIQADGDTAYTSPIWIRA